MTIAELTKDMQTHCVGRFLINLPKGFEPRKLHGPTTLFSPFGVDFQSAPKMQVEVYESNSSPEKFKQAIETTHHNLKNQLTAYEPKLPYLKFAQKITDVETLFRTYRGTGATEKSSTSQLHLLLNSHHILGKRSINHTLALIRNGSSR
jgi:hypothetical protein